MMIPTDKLFRWARAGRPGKAGQFHEFAQSWRTSSANDRGAQARRVKLDAQAAALAAVRIGRARMRTLP